MLETITAVNQAVNSFIWGIPAMVCIIGVGLLLSVRTGFLQLRKFPYAIKTTIGRMFRKRDASDGAMTPFQAVCTALAATVGTGNIAGVAGAIAIGGPGAVFWMWCSALLGMCTKFAEVTLAVHFRERNKNGELVGGPMYYIKNGLGRRWQDAHPMRFWAGGEVSFPWLSDGMWFLTQFRRWGLLKQAPDYLAVASRINRIDVWQAAAQAVGGISAPAARMRSSTLMDGTVWNGSDPEGYARHFSIQRKGA